MRICAVSDIHGNIDALEAVLSAVEGTYDHLLILGDLVGIGPAPDLVMRRVRGLTAFVLKGNWDDYVADAASFARFEALATPPPGAPPFRPPIPLAELRDNRAWTEARLSKGDLAYLSVLPRRIDIDLSPGLHITAFHATPASLEAGLPGALSDADLLRLAQSDAEVVLFGHTHVPYVKEIEGRHYINVSSLGLPMDNRPEAVVTWIERRGSGRIVIEQRRIPYDLDAVLRRLHERPVPGAEHLQHVYRHAAPAPY